MILVSGMKGGGQYILFQKVLGLFGAAAGLGQRFPSSPACFYWLAAATLRPSIVS